jgi:hypothetical protein
LNIYYSVSRILLRSLGGVIFISFGCFYYSIYPLSFCDKKGGVIFIFGPGMYFQTGQVIFVPEWPKGSLLVFWPYSVFGQNHLCVKDAVNRDSTFRDDVKTSRNSSSLSVVRTMCHPIRTLIGLLLHSSERSVIPSGHQTDQLRPDDMPLPSGHSTISRSFLCQLAPSGRLSSKSGRSSTLDQSLILSKFQGKEDQSTVRTNVSIR